MTDRSGADSIDPRASDLQSRRAFLFRAAPAAAAAAAVGIGGDVPPAAAAPKAAPQARATPPGGAESFKTVDSLSSNPRSVRDWGPILNVAMRSEINCFYFGPFTYPFTSEVSRPLGLMGVQFIGAGAEKTILRWDGTGSGVAFNLGGAEFPRIADCSFLYTSNGYTGRLVWIGGTSGTPGVTQGIIDNCRFSSTASIPAARCGVAIDGAVNALVRNCWFDSAWSSAAIRGRENPPLMTNADWCNVARFEFCTFRGPALANPGPMFVFDHCVFELGELAANESCISVDSGFTYNGYPPQLTLRDCSYWDNGPNSATNAVVEMPSEPGCTFAAYNCQEHTSGHGIQHLYKLLSGNASGADSTVVIVGGNSISPIDVGDGTTSTSQKNLVYIAAVEPVGPVLNINTPHKKVAVEGIERS